MITTDQILVEAVKQLNVAVAELLLAHHDIHGGPDDAASVPQAPQPRVSRDRKARLASSLTSLRHLQQQLDALK
jgi:hypothetical protein